MSAYPPLDDAELAAIYRETIRPLYAFVSRRVGGDVALAEDLVQDTWMRAVETWTRRGRPDTPLAWLTQVARHTLISHFRRVRPDLVDPSVLDLEAAAVRESGDAAALVSWGLARLGRRHAAVLEAFYFDGQTVAEIARALRKSDRAVEGRLRRARQRLRALLERAGVRTDARRSSTPASAHERTDHASHT